MSIKVLCSYSALDIWLDGTGRQNIKSELARNHQKLPEKFSSITTNDDLENLVESFNISQPVHLMVMYQIKGQNKLPCIFHRMPHNLPLSSFVRLSESTYLAVPELCLLQIANECPVHQLVLIINKLCGTYYIDRNSPMFQQNRTPVTNISKIKFFLEMVSGAHGVRKLARAVHYAVDNCNSPVEALVATIMCLPFSLGGYNISCHNMNSSIKLSSKGMGILGRDRCRPDFSWKNPRKVAVEYDSNISHLTTSQHAEDKKRYDALAASGYETRTLVADNLKSFNSIEMFFIDLRCLLGLNRRTNFLEKNVKIRRDVVNDLFFKKNLF